MLIFCKSFADWNALESEHTPVYLQNIQNIQNIVPDKQGKQS